MARDWSCTRDPEYCRKCGRRLVVVRDGGYFDRDSGEWSPGTYHECPKFAGRLWLRVITLGLGGDGMGHESHSATNAVFGREWR